MPSLVTNHSPPCAPENLVEGSVVLATFDSKPGRSAWSEMNFGEHPSSPRLGEYLVAEGRIAPMRHERNEPRRHDHHGGHGHTHGAADPTIATSERGIWAIKWSFVVLAAT